jgi:hypothetical protein
MSKSRAKAKMRLALENHERFARFVIVWCERAQPHHSPEQVRQAISAINGHPILVEYRDNEDHLERRK